jgi:hypothetical protein
VKFNIGDKVWTVGTEHMEKKIPCPDCLGQLAVTVILGDGSSVSVACGCGHGFEGPIGYTKIYVARLESKQRIVTGMSIDGDKVEYKLDGYGGSCFPASEKQVYSTKEEAEDQLSVLLAEQEKEVQRRIEWQKEDNRRTWAWNANYHRNRLKAAQHEIAYHSGQLTRAKAHVKKEAVFK